MTAPDESAPVWSLEMCAKHFGCSTKTVQEATRVNGLPYFMLGRLWRFRRADVLAWEEKQIQGKVA